LPRLLRGPWRMLQIQPPSKQRYGKRRGVRHFGSQPRLQLWSLLSTSEGLFPQAQPTQACPDRHAKVRAYLLREMWEEGRDLQLLWRPRSVLPLQQRRQEWLRYVSTQPGLQLPSLLPAGERLLPQAQPAQASQAPQAPQARASEHGQVRKELLG